VVAVVAGSFGLTSLATVAWAAARASSGGRLDGWFALFVAAPLLALVAAFQERRDRARLAGLLLVLSSVSLPPGGIYPINILVFAFGVAEIVAGPRDAPMWFRAARTTKEPVVRTY
jgi:hypothetical protein